MKFKGLLFEGIYSVVVFLFFRFLTLSVGNCLVLTVFLFLLHVIVRKIYTAIMKRKEVSPT